MPDYGEILAFLAANPPRLEVERKLHASVLELIARCLRSQDMLNDEDEPAERRGPMASRGTGLH
jgi:hypothetical protein